MAFGRLVAGLVAGIVVVGCAGLGEKDDTARSESGEIVEGGDLGAFRIRPGDCFQATMGAEIEAVDAVPCTQLHMFEVYAAFDLGGNDFPGASAVQELAGEGCYSRFEGFVGLDYEYSKYEFDALTPTAESWRELDDREVLCLISNYDGSRKSGSAQNAGE
jgi:hypothetical protein